MKLAFLDLPDERVDLISKARHDPSIQIVLVAHPDPEALALKIAEVLQIPRSTEPLDVLSLKPDRVALPSLASPSAAALLRAGISDRIFITLDDLSNDWPAAQASAPAEETNPIELWESRYDEAVGSARLSRIRAALALSEDRQFLFSEVLALAVEQSNADTGSIMVVDEDAQELRIAFADGLPAEVVRSTRQRLGEGVAGKVAREGISLIINEPVSHTRDRGERERSRPVAAMSAPLKVEGRTIGVINVSSNALGAVFTEQHLGRLNVVAEQISGILDRAIRVARRDRDALELRARREIEIAFNRKGLELSERLRMIAGQLAELLGAESAHIHIMDESLDRFRTVSSAGRYGQEGELPLHQGLLARALAGSKPLFLTVRPSRSSEGEGREPQTNLVLAPLTGTRPHGVLALECVGGEAAVDVEEFERLSGRIAEFLARSIEGQVDESEMSRRSAILGNLADIAGRIMTAHEPESLLSEVLGALRTLFPTGLVTARIKGDGGGGFLFRSAFEGSEPEHQRALEFESTLARRAVESRREIASLGLPSEELRRMIAEHDVSAYAFIPVRIDEDVTGVLGLLRPVSRRGATPAQGLSRLDVQTLRKLTLYVSLAMENAKRAGIRPERTIEDPLTGLLAIGGFDARVEEEVKRAERYRERFLLTVLAVPEFDRLSDQNGPVWVESFQKEFGQTLRRNVREVDALARIGEGRFAVLSPASDKDGGAFLKRLESLLAQLPAVRALGRPDGVRLSGRQFYFPDEIATGGELLSLVRTAA